MMMPWCIWGWGGGTKQTELKLEMVVGCACKASSQELRQEDQKFSSDLSYMLSSKPAWAT